MKTFFFIFCKSDILLEKKADGSFTIPFEEEPPVKVHPWTHIMDITPMENGNNVKALCIDMPITQDSKYEMCGLRKSYNLISRELYSKAGKCQELLYWDNNTKFCGICGAPMKMHTDISKRCT